MPPKRGRERARVLRSGALPGVEALHATFVDYRYAPHIHDGHTIALVDQGAAAFDLEGRRYEAPAGSVFVIPAGWAHTGESAVAEGYSYRVLYVTPEALSQLDLAGRACRSWSGIVLHRPPVAEALSRFHDRFNLLGTDLRADELGWAALEHVVGQGVLELDPPARRRVDHAAVRRALAYLNEHWAEPIPLRDLAQHAGSSPHYLVRTFHAEVGLPPSSFQRQLRVDHAKRLLRAGIPPVEAALRCGFYDQAHLTRHFHRMTGVTPAVYAAA